MGERITHSLLTAFQENRASRLGEAICFVLAVRSLHSIRHAVRPSPHAIVWMQSHRMPVESSVQQIVLAEPHVQCYTENI
jgi:hypothetical protein